MPKKKKAMMCKGAVRRQNLWGSPLTGWGRVELCQGADTVCAVRFASSSLFSLLAKVLGENSWNSIDVMT